MKHILSLFLFSISTFCVYDLAGEYNNPVGERIILNRDKSFMHIFQVGHTAYWQKGKWKERKDTLYLEPIIMYDTLRINMQKNLIVSRDTTPNLHIYIDDETEYEDSKFRKRQAQVNTTYTKYVFKNNKLIAIEHDGNLRMSAPKHELLINHSLENYYDPSYIKVK